MEGQRPSAPLKRRDLLRAIGLSAGGAAMYRAMSSLGLAATSPTRSPPDLQGTQPGTSVLILGAGIAGMTAAYELRRAGYQVQVLEYNSRPGGRNWSLRGGDSYTELGGITQHCEFDPGLYINPGPWRLPYHHQGILGYAKRLGVALEPFIQVNYNAYVHSQNAFGGKPQRYREVKADYQGHVAELLAKALHRETLDDGLSHEDQERLLASLRDWGALDSQYRYVVGEDSSVRRGFKTPRGGGSSGRPRYSEPVGLQETLSAQFWERIALGDELDMQTTMFQPVGGMGRIGEAFGRELGPLIRYNAKVIDIRQDESGVTVIYEDTRSPGKSSTAHAQWCLCTLPLSILSQIPMNVGADMAAAIHAVPYASTVKVGLQFKRRFWEEDEQIYGGVTYTDLPISNISYPNCDYQSAGKGVLLGAYVWGLDAMEFTSMTPQERIRKAVEYGTRIHPQYPQEFDNGIAVAWHRAPFAMGCFGMWTEETRAQHYDHLCAIDGRIALAGDHVSFFDGWQEGAVTSALEAITRLHQRTIATARQE
jgi:monoamine oxidase